jgi:RNA polymerase sigma factor (sigma-70 family)
MTRLRRYMNVNAPSEAILDAATTADTALDIEALFRARFDRVARVIARVVRDPARAEELAVEAFVRLWRTPRAHTHAEAWLYRTAVRLGLDELRRQNRRNRYENLLAVIRRIPTPEQIHAAAEEQNRVRVVLASLPERQAELLLLRSHDLSYGELAAALEIHPASLGTLLARAQKSFREEYVRRYGPQQ